MLRNWNLPQSETIKTIIEIQTKFDLLKYIIYFLLISSKDAKSFLKKWLGLFFK